MDIGADEIVVAAPPDHDGEPVRVFRTLTPDLVALVTGWSPAALIRSRLSCRPGFLGAEECLEFDLVAVLGFAASSVQTIITEIGTDMERFPTVKHFCSWLGLAPRNDISGGKVLRSRTQKVVNRAAQAFRQAAQSVSRSDSAIRGLLSDIRARKGPQQATVATAHKIARIVYHLLKYGEAYEAESAEAYDRNAKNASCAPDPSGKQAGLYPDANERNNTCIAHPVSI